MQPGYYYQTSPVDEYNILYNLQGMSGSNTQAWNECIFCILFLSLKLRIIQKVHMIMISGSNLQAWDSEGLQINIKMKLKTLMLENFDFNTNI